MHQSSFLGVARQTWAFPDGLWVSTGLVFTCISCVLSGPKHTTYALFTRITKNFKYFWRTYSFAPPHSAFLVHNWVSENILHEGVRTGVGTICGACVCVSRRGSEDLGFNLPTESILLNRERRSKMDLFGLIFLSVHLNKQWSQELIHSLTASLPLLSPSLNHHFLSTCSIPSSI